MSDRQQAQRRGWWMVCLLLVAAGCCPQKQPYTGPTLPFTDVVQKINANAQQIQTIWAHTDYSATFVDPDTHESHSINGGDGNLMYRKPSEMRLTGNAIIGPVFELGSTRDEYWASVFVSKVHTQWWGHYRNLGKPCCKPIPIRPDLVMDVLGVQDIATDLLRPPAPVMRFNPEEWAYMLTWVMPLQTYWAAQREVWYDVRTFLPTRVLLYDDNGRVVLRAALSDWEHVGGDPAAPMMATRFALYFPDTGSRMDLRLSQLQFKKNGLPKDGTIARRPAADLKVIQLDEACGD